MISIGGIADRRHHVQLSVSVMGVGPIIQVLSEEADLFLFFVFFLVWGIYEDRCFWSQPAGCFYRVNWWSWSDYGVSICDFCDLNGKLDWD